MTKTIITIETPSTPATRENLADFVSALLDARLNFSVTQSVTVNEAQTEAGKRRAEGRAKTAAARAALAEKRAAGTINYKPKKARRSFKGINADDPRLVHDKKNRRIDVASSLRNIGLTRDDLINKKTKLGSIEHSIKQALHRQDTEATKRAGKNVAHQAADRRGTLTLGGVQRKL